MNTTTVGVDLAKYTFSVCVVDSHGRVQLRRDFRRDAFHAVASNSDCNHV